MHSRVQILPWQTMKVVSLFLSLRFPSLSSLCSFLSFLSLSFLFFPSLMVPGGTIWFFLTQGNCSMSSVDCWSQNININLYFIFDLQPPTPFPNEKTMFAYFNTWLLIWIPLYSITYIEVRQMIWKFSAARYQKYSLLMALPPLS